METAGHQRVTPSYSTSTSSDAPSPTHAHPAGGSGQVAASSETSRFHSRPSSCHANVSLHDSTASRMVASIDPSADTLATIAGHHLVSPACSTSTRIGMPSSGHSQPFGGFLLGGLPGLPLQRSAPSGRSASTAPRALQESTPLGETYR